MKMRQAFAAALLLASPAFAHHPGGRLDEVTASREPAFEVTDSRSLPHLDIADAAGRDVSLDEMTGRIIVLSFSPVGCGAPCEAQQRLIEQVRNSVNITPMRDVVSFVKVAEPRAAVLAAGENFVQAHPVRSKVVADLAATFAGLSSRGGKEPMVHIIDRGGRHAGLFHGSAFRHADMMLYINGLTNMRPPEPSFRDRLSGFFR